MTITSAASLPSHGQEAQFPRFRSFRRNSGRSVVPRMSAASLPQRHVPRIALADDPPRGRILVVTDHAPLALDVQRILKNAGYRAVGSAESAEEAERLAGRPVDGAVVDLQLAGSAAASIANRLVQEGIPFVWLTDRSDAIPQGHERAPTVNKPVSGEYLIQTLERALSSGQLSGKRSFYPVPPPQQVWPRVFPQL